MPNQTMIVQRSSRQQAARIACLVPMNTVRFSGSIETMGVSMPCARNMEIYGENESADYLYKVVSGVVRTYKLLNDGRRQVGSFYLPDDIFGLEIGGEHTSSAEAVAVSKIQVIKRSAVIALAGRDKEVARQLWSLTATELRRAGSYHVAAEDRAGACRRFPLEMAERNLGASEFDLPMSRQDIADYLGLTIETVSRTLTQLANSGAIAVPTSRHIVLRRRGALNRMNA
jgi:CRP/FNR family transcriptional regulator, nitrogen fixation regulation protein